MGHLDTESIPGMDLDVLPGDVRLEVVSGPDAGLAETLETFPFVVGNDASCNLTLTDGAVSRNHFEIHFQEGRFRIIDLDSTNGTRVDRAIIREAYLAPGQLIGVGRSLIRFGPRLRIDNVAPSKVTKFSDLLGRSEVMRRVFTLLERVARTDATVLLTGETGTGKELAARAVHEASPRSNNKMGVFDAGAVPASLIESELFGHEKGAFTGAVSQRTGLFEAADGGTLFLDEIGELPLELQPRLLRVLETKQVRRVGADRQRRVDVRVVAATNRDLKAESRKGTFRQDLYWRLSVIEIHMPPLRERREDIPMLVEAYLEEHNVRPPRPDVMSQLAGFDWPGNVRQLRNVLERSIAMSTGGVLDPAVVRSVLQEAETDVWR